MLHYREIDAPICSLIVAADGEALVAVRLAPVGQSSEPDATWEKQVTPLLARCAEQLQQYFRRERRELSIPCRPRGTDFQQSVWHTLREIPFGQTWTYGQLAERLGRPEAVRAVGQAIRANPTPIFIPCHRVIGSDNSIKGHPGGADMKRALLDFEAFG
ncbi:methylated-DNA--[protein]-cysteine S-methyltransferase [Microbulbifer halophilus]|uniref:Methylated-DNA--protein-cysteine methyltransferase n=1 Tax=Microbulbifer halophilus TaxID=453963 RepID=A0ABW5EC28_9GAMM|nr:methylated-DNA--[protein]-cysteine S-methyltransferase [Microbulbifer halophilus]MCW8126651.1 methylated-DNA--[protein]-cysteine S-methyltransferase [Microbulbifer halophilus]